MDFLSIYVMENPIGVIIVAMGSAILGWLAFYIRYYIYRWILIITIPLIISYYAYWIPIWNSGSTDPQNAGYAIIFIPVIAYIGYIIAGITFFIHERMFSKRNISVDK